MDDIRLTCVLKPHQGERWVLTRIRKKIVLLDAAQKTVTSIPVGEARMRIHVPSFLASSRHIVIESFDGTLLQFESKPKTLEKIRALIEECALDAPRATAKAYRKAALRDLLIGGGSFLLGAIVTCASFLFAAPDGKFLVATGLLVVGVVEIARGTYYAIRASQYGRPKAAAKRKDWQEEGGIE
jgi:hypothetical protein